MTRKNGNSAFLKIFLGEIALIVFFASLCAGMYVESRKDKADKSQVEAENIMSNLYVEMPDGEQVPWDKSPYSRVVIRLPEKPKATTKVKKLATTKQPSGKTLVRLSDIEQLVLQLAEEAEFKNVYLLKRIIRCESSWRPDAINWSSRDYGLWQINLRHNPEVTKECALDADCATKWAIEQIQSGNVWKWNASRYCWGGSI